MLMDILYVVIGLIVGIIIGFFCIETFYDEVFKEEPTDQWRDDSSTDDADGQKAFSKTDQSNDEINGKVYVKPYKLFYFFALLFWRNAKCSL